jgi:hypothetical protein
MISLGSTRSFGPKPSLGSQLIRLFENPLALDLLEHGAVRESVALEALARHPRGEAPWFGDRSGTNSRAGRFVGGCLPGHMKRLLPSGKTKCIDCQRAKWREKAQARRSTTGEKRGSRPRRRLVDVVSQPYEARR